MRWYLILTVVGTVHGAPYQWDRHVSARSQQDCEAVRELLAEPSRARCWGTTTDLVQP